MSGLTRRAAWLREVRGALSLSSGYRLWRRPSEAQATLRSRLCRTTSPPDSAPREPLAQLLEDVVLVEGEGEADPFSALHEDTQCRCLDVCGDALDNDCDGTADEAACAECGPEEICGDGIDNDCDCVVDECSDEICDDGVDNDGDGNVDRDDLECQDPK